MHKSKVARFLAHPVYSCDIKIRQTATVDNKINLSKKFQITVPTSNSLWLLSLYTWRVQLVPSEKYGQEEILLRV